MEASLEPNQTQTPGIPGVPEFTGKPGNIMNDLAALAAEQAPQVAPVAPQAEVAPQPETTPAQAEAPATVPEKFKAPDGSLDTAKLEKSTVNVEEALAKYLEKEKQLRQKMNEVNRLSQMPTAPAAPVAPVAQQAQQPLTPMEIQMAQDLINEAAANGYQMPQGQAIAQARVLAKTLYAKAEYEASLTEQLRVKLEDQDRRRELEEIAKYDDRVLSPEGFDALSKIRESKPWINQSPTPWTEAYNYYLAEQAKAARLKGTVLPTPTGQTAKAPPTPVSPAPRAVVQPTGPDFNAMTPDQITAHVKTLSPEAERAFWASRGLRFK